MRVILVNATAARSSGALSILKQFLGNVERCASEDKFIVFVDVDFEYKHIENVEFVKQDTKKWIKRILWDYKGIKKWCQNHQIIPNVIISLQNTGVNWNIPQCIYYHQPLPLSDKKWNPFKKEEFALFCYKYFYSFFVKKYMNDKTHVVVQIPSIKEVFLRKFKIYFNQVSVLPPQLNGVDYSKVAAVHFKDEYFHFIYPATPLIYKNHMEIVNALSYLMKHHFKLVQKIRVHLTFSMHMNSFLHQQIVQAGLQDVFVFEETMPFAKLLGYYKGCDALLFPSYIESFGLPLIEAAGAGIPIIASDLPYVHDVVGNYEGIHFAELHNSEMWGKKIVSVCKEQLRYKPFQYSVDDSWKQFFEIIKSLK